MVDTAVSAQAHAHKTHTHTHTPQLYIEKARMDEVAEGSFDQLKLRIDVGDIVGVEGGVKRTEKGELSVMATKLEVREGAGLGLD